MMHEFLARFRRFGFCASICSGRGDEGLCDLQGQAMHELGAARVRHKFVHSLFLLLRASGDSSAGGRGWLECSKRRCRRHAFGC